MYLEMVSLSQIPNERLVNWKPLRRSPSHAETIYTISSSSGSTPHQPTKRLRTACDLCRQCRIKCSGGSTCQRCASNGLKCNYGVSMRHGRTKANARPTPSFSSRTRSKSAVPNEERAIQNADFPGFTNNDPMTNINSDDGLDDLAVLTDREYLTGSGGFMRTSPMSKDLNFNYPSPNTNIFPVCTVQPT